MRGHSRISRLRRACLVVPAAADAMVEKARRLYVDEVILDLEDAVLMAKKTDTTRRQLANALAREWRSRTVAVRVNGVRTEWFNGDVSRLAEWAGGCVDVIVVPKVETVDDVVAVVDAVRGLGLDVGLEVQIESASGLVHVEQIAAADRVEALVFGPGDYAASLGIVQQSLGGFDPTYPGDQWHYVRSRMAVAARAYGVDAIDGPYAAFTDVAGLVETAARARAVGFSGKWVIHPAQIEACQQVFSPTPDEIVWAQRVLDVLNDACRRGSGAAVLDHTMVDDATRRLAEDVLARAGADQTAREEGRDEL